MKNIGFLDPCAGEQFVIRHVCLRPEFGQGRDVDADVKAFENFERTVDSATYKGIARQALNRKPDAVKMVLYFALDAMVRVVDSSSSKRFRAEVRSSGMSKKIVRYQECLLHRCADVASWLLSLNPGISVVGVDNGRLSLACRTLALPWSLVRIIKGHSVAYRMPSRPRQRDAKAKEALDYLRDCQHLIGASTRLGDPSLSAKDRAARFRRLAGEDRGDDDPSANLESAEIVGIFDATKDEWTVSWKGVISEKTFTVPCNFTALHVLFDALLHATPTDDPTRWRVDLVKLSKLYWLKHFESIEAVLSKERDDSDRMPSGRTVPVPHEESLARREEITRTYNMKILDAARKAISRAKQILRQQHPLAKDKLKGLVVYEDRKLWTSVSPDRVHVEM